MESILHERAPSHMPRTSTSSLLIPPSPTLLEMSTESLTSTDSAAYWDGKPPAPEILTPTTNWKAWKTSIKIHARLKGVWQYIDPEEPERNHPELEEPEKPRVSTVRPGATSIVDLGDEDFIELSVYVERYWTEYRSWEKLQDSIHAISKLIRSHVDWRYFELVEDGESPRAQMIVLANAYKSSHLQSLQSEWDHIQMMARQPVVQQFFEGWKSFFDKCSEHSDYSFANARALWDTLDQVRYPARSQRAQALENQFWVDSSEGSGAVGDSQ